MDSLAKDLYATLAKSLDQYAQVVADKFNLDKDEVVEAWNGAVSSELKVEKKQTKAKPRAKQAKTDDTDVCSYEFKKGKNSGSKCTAKVCTDSTSYCRKHKGQEGKEDSGDKKTKTKSKNPKAEEKEKETKAVKTMTKPAEQLALGKNKYGHYEHKSTKFVFDKATKEVFGKQVGDKVEDLTDEDVELCKSHNFKYILPKTLSSKNDKKDEVEDEAEDEVEEEDDEEEEEEED